MAYCSSTLKTQGVNINKRFFNEAIHQLQDFCDYSCSFLIHFDAHRERIYFAHKCASKRAVSLLQAAQTAHSPAALETNIQQLTSLDVIRSKSVVPPRRSLIETRPESKRKTSAKLAMINHAALILSLTPIRDKKNRFAKDANSRDDYGLLCFTLCFSA